MNIPWQMIFDLILQLFENCNREQARAELENPGPLTRIRVRRAARRAAGDAWRGNQRAIMQRIWSDHAKMDGNDREELIDEALEGGAP